MVTFELVTKQMKDGKNIVKCTQHVKCYLSLER